MEVKSIIAKGLIVLAVVGVANYLFFQPTEEKYSLDELSEFAEQKGKTGVENTEWAEFKTYFVDGCNKNGNNKKYCECAVNYIENNNTRESVYLMASEFFQSDDNARLPVMMSDAIYACSGLYVRDL